MRCCVLSTDHHTEKWRKIMEIFKNVKEFFFPSEMPDQGSSAPAQEPQPPHQGAEEMMQGAERGSKNIVNI